MKRSLEEMEDGNSTKHPSMSIPTKYLLVGMTNQVDLSVETTLNSTSTDTCGSNTDQCSPNIIHVATPTVLVTKEFDVDTRNCEILKPNISNVTTTAIETAPSTSTLPLISNANGNSESTSTLELPGIRQLWKEMGANGDNESLNKLEAIREADRVSRRKSRQLLKIRGQNGDPAALEIIARNRVADTEAHRKRRADVLSKAGDGDVVAIAQLEKVKSRYANSIKKNKTIVDNDINGTAIAKPKRKYTKHNATQSTTNNSNSNFTSNSSSNSNPNNEIYVGNVEAEAISALELLHNSNVTLQPGPFEPAPIR